MKILRKYYGRHREFMMNPVFMGALALKLLAGAFCYSYFNRDLFIPFINFWVDSGFQNPWDEFLRRDVLNAFPYSSAMLFLLGFPTALAAPLFGGAASIPLPLQLLLMRLPLLAADLAMYLILCRWFEAKWKYVLWIYWCSPVLFFVSYVHGQIDALPTAFLFASLWYLTKLSPLATGLALGLGIGTKFHLLMAVPLFSAYFFKSGEHASLRRRNTFLFAISLAATLAVLISPWLSSPGYRQLVLQPKEGSWIYEFFWSFGPGLKVFLAPAVSLILMLHFFSYRSYSRDMIVLYLGLLYSTLILFVHPMPGWVYWSFPFLCYFLVREQLFRYAPFWAYTGFYLLYYSVFSDTSAIVPSGWLPLRGTEAFERLKDLTFTGMQASLALTTYWVYRMGIHRYSRYARSPLTFGIGGDSGSGKHTLGNVLTDLLGKENVVKLFGDDYHRWERGHPQYQEFTHLNPNSNYFLAPVEHISELKQGLSVVKTHYDHTLGRFKRPARVDSNRFILFLGLHPFVFGKMRSLFDLKMFLDTEDSLQQYWKNQRDQRDRGHAPDAIALEIQRRSADAKKFVVPQKAQADWVVRYYPGAPLDAVSAGGTPDIRAQHRIASRFVSIENLVAELRQAGDGLTVTWTLDEGLQHQILELSGSLSQETVLLIAQRLFPDMGSLFENESPVWSGGINGLSQLIFASLLHETVHE